MFYCKTSKVLHSFCFSRHFRHTHTRLSFEKTPKIWFKTSRKQTNKKETHARCLEENHPVMWQSLGLALISNTEDSVALVILMLQVAVRLLWHFAYMSPISTCDAEASSVQSAPEATRGLSKCTRFEMLRWVCHADWEQRNDLCKSRVNCPNWPPPFFLAKEMVLAGAPSKCIKSWKYHTKKWLRTVSVDRSPKKRVPRQISQTKMNKKESDKEWPTTSIT